MTDILIATLELGPATVLTNGTVLKNEWLERLRDAEARSIFSLEFRVSIDGFTADQNDPVRGDGTFYRAMDGVGKLVQFGFIPIITAVRTWNIGDEHEMISGFQRVLKQQGYKHPRLKILPTLQIGAEAIRSTGYRNEERVTREMMEGYDQSLLVCSYSRIVTDRGVHVCPILIESPDSLLSQSLVDSVRPFPLGHGACSTCYQYGAICSNASGNLRSPNSAKPDQGRRLE